MNEENIYIDVIAAAKISPGRPSANAVWRWARRGCRARNGERLHLQHIRRGAKIFTTANWLHEFFTALATADATKPTQKTTEAAERNTARSIRVADAEAELGIK